MHEEKGKIILHFMRNYATLGSMHNLWLANGGGIILSNTSLPALNAIRDCFPSLKDADVRHGMTPDDKVRWLAIQQEAGIYFDDSQKTIEKIKEQTAWTAILVR